MSEGDASEQCAPELGKGRAIALSDRRFHVTAVPPDSHVQSAILVTGAGSARSASDHVSRDRPFGPGVRCRQRARDEVHVDLDEVPVDVDRVRVVLDAGGTPLGQVAAPTMRVGTELGDVVAGTR